LEGFFSILREERGLAERGEQRLQLHRQADVSADLEPPGHGDGRSTQLALQNLDAILPAHRERDVRILVHPVGHLADPTPNRENVLASLGAAQVELINRIDILGRICVELARKQLEKVLNGGGLHDSWNGKSSGIGTGSRATAAPDPKLVTERNRRGTATRAEEIFGEGLDDRRVITLAAEYIEIGVIRIVGKMAADQRRRDQLHHGIAGDPT